MSDPINEETPSTPTLSEAEAFAMAEPRPKFRGAVDLVALMIFGPAVGVLCFHAYPRLAPALIYSIGLMFLFGISAGYHFFTWGPKALKWWQRFDHAMIYVFIAASYTPASMTVIKAPVDSYLMITVWSAAALGALKTILWPKAPRFLSVGLYIAMGWSVLVWFDEFAGPISSETLWWFVAGGVIYSLAGAIYAIKWPNPAPKVFGYHESMHVGLIFAVAAQFVAQWQVFSTAASMATP